MTEVLTQVTAQLTELQNIKQGLDFEMSPA